MNIRHRVCVVAIAAGGISVGAPSSVRAQSETEAPTTEGRSSILDVIRDSFEDEHRTWRPVVGIMVPGAGIGGGLTLQSPLTESQPLGVSLDGQLSIRNYQQVTLRGGLLANRRDLPALRALDSSLTSMIDAGEPHARGIALYIEHRYRRLPGLSLFGEDSGEVVRTDFGVRRRTTDLVLQWKQSSHWGLGARVGSMLTTRFDGTDDKRVNTEDQFGALLDAARGESVRYFTAGLGIAIDRRLETSRTHAGWLMQAAATGFRSSDSGSASFTRLALDARAYQPLLSRRHVLAARFLVSRDYRDNSGPPVPYFLQQSLGGSSSLRAFSSYRFRGEGLASFTLESRWTVHRRLDVVPFVDIGSVVRPPLDPGPTGALTSVGIGLRGRHEGKTVGRLELAYGREGFRALVAVESPF